MTRKSHILIVDDSKTNRLALSFGLERYGYSVGWAENGRQALEMLHQEPFELVLLDIMMPEMDGYQVLEQMRRHKRLRNIPVIVISALEEMDSVVKCIEMGAEDYLPRSFDPILLRARIAACLEKKHLQDQLAARTNELEETNASLQISNEELDAFAHTVAHDLKSPLAVITGYTDLLLQTASQISPVDAVDILHTIKRAGHKSINIINELLLLASVRKGEVEVQPLNMEEIVAQAQYRLSLMIQEYGGHLIIPSEWPVAQGYEPWIEEVWINYISNGLKYGGDAPRLELGAIVDEAETIRFWIRDQGPGIPKTAQSTLFTEFTRLDNIHAEGHGLGLSIVKRIVKKLGGEVGVESEVGQGSLFYFTLPQGGDL